MSRQVKGFYENLIGSGFAELAREARGIANEATSDYEMQLILLVQQNIKRLRTARQEQDSTFGVLDAKKGSHTSKSNKFISK